MSKAAKPKRIKHTITITFETSSRVKKSAITQVAMDARVQLETLEDDFNIEYTNPNYTLKSVKVGDHD